MSLTGIRLQQVCEKVDLGESETLSIDAILTGVEPKRWVK